MDVTQLLLKLSMTANIEVVVPLLPKMLRITYQASRYALLERLDRVCEGCSPWLIDQQVDVLGHHDISVDAKHETATDAVERVFKDWGCI